MTPSSSTYLQSSRRHKYYLDSTTSFFTEVGVALRNCRLSGIVQDAHAKTPTPDAHVWRWSVYIESRQEVLYSSQAFVLRPEIFSSLMNIMHMIKQLIARRLVGEVQKQWSVSMQVGCTLWTTINSFGLNTKLELCKHWYFTAVFCIQTVYYVYCWLEWLQCFRATTAMYLIQAQALASRLCTGSHG